MHRITDIARGVAALVTTLALLLGLPALLAAMVGWPLPTTTPSIDLIRTHLTDGDPPDLFVIKLLAVIVWILWTQLAVGLLIEIRASIAGRASRRAPLLPGIQLLAAKLVTWVTLVLTALAPARPVIAAPLTPIEATTSLVDSQAARVLVGAHRSGSSNVELGAATDETAVAPFTYRTSRDDSWWSIAEDLLGDGLRWSDVRDANLGRRTADGTTIDATTDTVRAGWRLNLPADATRPLTGDDSEVADDAPATGETVRVEPGDHFWAIADEQLTEAWGRQPSDDEIASYWAELVAANTDRLLPPGDPNLIYPEQEFAVPTLPPNPDIDVDLNGDQIVTNPAPTPIDTAPAPEPTPPEAPPFPATGVEAPAASTPVVEPTAPATPAPADAPSTEPAGGGSVVEDVEDLVRPLAYVAGTGLFGALLLANLRRLRHIQAARRRPGTVIDTPDDAAAEFEREIRAVATDGEDARYIAATNRYLAHQLEHQKGSALPAVIAARAGTHGVELLLDEPCQPVASFVAGDSDLPTWRLRADITARAMEADATDAHPYAPGLLVVGTTESGDLLIDFEQLAATSIEGDPEVVLGFQRALVAAAIAAPWGDQNQIAAIGIHGLDGLDCSRITQPEDPVEWAKQLAIKMRAGAGRAARSPYEERVDHGTVTFPTIVVIGPDPAHAGIAQHLAPVAELAYSDLTVIAAAPMSSHHRVVIVDGIATLEPQGVDFEPITLDAEHLAATERLLRTAADTQTGPPPDWVEPESQEEISTAEAATEPLVDAGKEAPDDGSGVEALIAEIMAPQPIEVRLLGRLPKVEALDGEASPKLEAIIAYLAFHGEVPAQRLREEFWPASESRTGADTAMMRIRNLLGVTEDGAPRIPSARGSGTYLLNEVGCDWTRAVRLLDGARAAANVEDEAALLDAVCELIDGHIAADASPVNYSWLLRDPGTYTQMETALVDAAHRRAELALEAGDIPRAKWAARKGLTVVEGQESLYRMQMRVAAEAGDPDGINAAFREAQRAAESYGFDEEVQPETQALYESLAGRGSGVARPESAER
jgi:hypothetical protein